MEKLFRIRFFDRRGGVINTKFYQSQETFDKGLARAEASHQRQFAPKYKSYDAHETIVEWKK